MIPDLSNQESINNKTEVAESEASTSVETTSSDESSNTDEVKPILQINDASAPTKKENALTVTNIVLGGISLLLAGILIGVLLNNSKSTKKETD